MKCLLLLVITIAASNSVCARCPDISALTDAIGSKSVYVGELHGTQQIPQLVECLVRKDIEKNIAPLFVSIELPNIARDPASIYWTGTDGRASAAMWDLTQFLLQQAKLGKLTLFFHADHPEADQAAYDKRIGEDLAKLSQRATLIAYGGNFHSRKGVAEYSPGLEPAGSFTGDRVMHVTFSAAKPGSAWFCAGSDFPCGAHPLPASSLVSAPVVGKLYDGSSMAHDYIFMLDHFSASFPKMKRK